MYYVVIIILIIIAVGFLIYLRKKQAGSQPGQPPQKGIIR